MNLKDKQMQFNKILRLVLRIILFILVLVLAINNIQTVEFNLLGIYILKLPLIMLTALFLILGVILGILFNFMSKLELKHEIKQLNKQLNKLQQVKDSVDSI